MRIIVSDTSCIIDLHKVELLLALFELPYTFVIPHSLFENELLRLTEQEKEELLQRGLEVRELDGDGVARAQEYLNTHRALQLNDCFALRMAEEIEDAILMTGDATLRAVATSKTIEVHGVLWTADELDKHEVADRTVLQLAMRAFQDDPLVFLPEDELRRRIHRFGRKRRAQ